MRVVIAGGHGQVALRLEELLSARGHNPIGLIRNPDHADDLHQAGAAATVCDLETVSADTLATHLDGADAVVFAAGAGPGSGTARKLTVDRDAAILLADAAVKAGVGRYVMVSAMGTDREPPAGTDETFAAYLRAKTEADAYLRARENLQWTILRPGRLTNDEGTGRVRLAPHTDRGAVPRDDVAAVLAGLLTTPDTAGLTLELIAGDHTVEDAVTAAAQHKYR